MKRALACGRLLLSVSSPSSPAAGLSSSLLSVAAGLAPAWVLVSAVENTDARLKFDTVPVAETAGHLHRGDEKMTETISSVTPQSDCIVRKKKDQTNQKRVSKKKQTAHCLSCHCHLGVRQYGQQKKPQHCNTLFWISWISIIFDGRVLDTDGGTKNFRWPW